MGGGGNLPKCVPSILAGGGNWVVVVICQNVCPRFWSGSGFWVVAGFRGVGGRWDSGFRISLERKLINDLFNLYYTALFYSIFLFFAFFPFMHTFFSRPLFWRLLKI